MNEEQRAAELDPGAEPIVSREVAVVATPPKPPIQLDENRGYILPTTIDEAFRFAQAVVAGNLAPDSYKNDPSKVMVGVMAAMEAGLPPLYGLRQIAIINGRPVAWGDALMALVQSKNLLEKQTVREIGQGFDPDLPLNEWPSDFGFSVSLWRRGNPEPFVGTYTVADAKRSKLWLNTAKRPWMDSPKRMLFIRARAFPLRDGFADALAGLAIREEVEDTHGPDKPVVDASFLDDEPITATAEEQSTDKAKLFAPEEE